ncbi:T9SS type A sorting domain-containing protein [Hymenobacter sp. BT683]|uniref:T9SS type A sorting domain-containing protein n=1 Tax=Hymenobacter jeongseonensis TaxID=2791027 RepID=A0ABS0IGG8_9BACT|nr:T9SS type A sorting domain-containing protein [Hymenobacter jeongseonensis]MBF9237023.1 T9SS type A sorting domain-containing protein [Hymenobacter jeongseonensis]
MKIRFTLTLGLLSSALTGFAQVLTNDGAAITVQSGAVLYISGAVQSTAPSTLLNAGTVEVTGDLNNAGTLTSTGLLRFTGTTNQVFSPGAATVADLTLNNAGAAGQRTLSIPADLTISGQLTLLNGLVRTAPTTTLTLPEGASLTGEQAGRYVQGNLRAVRTAVNGLNPVTFPNSAVLDPKGQNLGTVSITRTAGLGTVGLSTGAGLTPAGIDRVWTVEASNAGQPTAATPAALTLSWVSDDDNGFDLATLGQLWQAASAAGPWVPQGTAASAAARSITGSITQLGTFTVSNFSDPLPVELVRFTAEPQGEDALLRWATATEKNNDHFDVEASPDGQVFRRIGQVAGHGSTSQPQQYQLVDPGIARYAADPVYYRLRQVDRDGTATYSPVRTVRVKGAIGFAVQLYPNPIRSGEGLMLQVRTSAAGPLRWQLTDALGRTLTNQTTTVLTGTNTLPLGTLTNLATGVYVLRVQQGSHHQAIKLVLE